MHPRRQCDCLSRFWEKKKREINLEILFLVWKVTCNVESLDSLIDFEGLSKSQGTFVNEQVI
jgi:hypothetical protein